MHRHLIEKDKYAMSSWLKCIGDKQEVLMIEHPGTSKQQFHTTAPGRTSVFVPDQLNRINEGNKEDESPDWFTANVWHTCSPEQEAFRNEVENIPITWPERDAQEKAYLSARFPGDTAKLITMQPAPAKHRAESRSYFTANISRNFLEVEEDLIGNSRKSPEDFKTADCKQHEEKVNEAAYAELGELTGEPVRTVNLEITEEIVKTQGKFPGYAWFDRRKLVWKIKEPGTGTNEEPRAFSSKLKVNIAGGNDRICLRKPEDEAAPADIAWNYLPVLRSLAYASLTRFDL